VNPIAPPPKVGYNVGSTPDLQGDHVRVRVAGGWSRGASAPGLRRGLAALCGAGLLTAVLTSGLPAGANLSGGGSAGPNTGTGSAYGIGATGPVVIHPTPGVVLPPTGAAQSASVASASIPPIIYGGALQASTSSKNFTLATESITSSASVSNVALFGVKTKGNAEFPVLAAVKITSAATTCTSNANGSSAAVTGLSLSIAGRPVTFPTPLPANYNLTPLQTGALVGVALVTLNAQDGLNTSDSTTISVGAVRIIVLGSLGHSETITIAASACGASGPNIHPISTIVPEYAWAIVLPVLGGVILAAGGVLVYRRRRIGVA
jgi:hypothetical protein